MTRGTGALYRCFIYYCSLERLATIRLALPALTGITQHTG